LGEQIYIKMKSKFFDEVFENQLVVGTDLMLETAQEVVAEHVPAYLMHLYPQAVTALMCAYLRRTPKYKNVNVEFIRKNGVTLHLNSEDNPYNFTALEMATNIQLAETEYYKLIGELTAEVEAYGIKIPEDINKFSPGILKFARQTQRRIGTSKFKTLLVENS
jgi:hypothetical protein